MYRYLLASFAISFVLISCNSKDDTSPEEELQVEENFYALTIGNSWEYEYYQRIPQTEEFVLLDFLEHVEIIGTIEIDGETFYEQRTVITGSGNVPPGCGEMGESFQKRRDSLGYLVDEAGNILYSSDSTDDYTMSEAEWGDVFGILENDSQTLVVDAGTFTCSDNLIYAILENGEIAPGSENNYYKDQMGQIMKTYSTVTNKLHIWEKRLISLEIVEE